MDPWEEYAAAPVTALDNGPWNDYAASTSTKGTSNAALPSNIPASPPGSSSAGGIWDKIKPYITSGDPIADLKHGGALAARAMIQGGTGTTGMVADLPFQIANLFGANKQLPTQAQSQMLDQALGTPRDIGEKALLFGGSMAAGAGMDPVMQAARAAMPPALYTQPPQFSGPALNAQTINNGMDAGLKVTPSTTPNAGLGSKLLELLGGKSALNTNMQNKNRTVVDDLANRIIGNPQGAAIDDAAVNRAIGATYENGYAPIRNIPLVSMGPRYTSDLQNIAQATPTTGLGTFNPTEVAQAYAQPFMGGAEAVDNIRALRQMAHDATMSNAVDKTLRANTYQNVANAIENAVGRNIPAENLAGYQAARSQIAQQYAVKKAIVDGTGSINATNIGNQLAAGSRAGGVSPFTGDLSMIGNMARAAPTTLKYPNAGPSLLTGADMSLLGGAGGMAAKGDIGTAAALAAAGVARPAIRALLLSPAYQRMFLRPSIGQGAMTQLLQNPTLQSGIPAAIQNSGLFNQQQK